MTDPKILTGIDHPVIAIRDMTAARAAYERLGFTIPPRGSHLEWGTGNWCIMFPEDYLELRGIIDPQKYTHGLEQFLEKQEGLMGVAFGTDDTQQSHDTLVERGLHPQPVRQLTRNFELPEGTVQPRFSLCFQDESETPGLMSVVLCQHLTPQLLRRPEWLEHKNGVYAVAAMVGVVEDVNHAASLQKLFGPEAMSHADDRLTIDVGRGQQIVLLSVSTTAKEFVDCSVQTSTDFGHLRTVILRVHDLAATGAYLVIQGIESIRTPQGAIRLHPRYACGVVLEFVE